MAPNPHHMLKAGRIAADLTQLQVAEHLGYTTAQFVSNWERGICLPPIEALPVVARLFKLGQKELIDAIIEHEAAQHRAELETEFKRSKRK